MTAAVGKNGYADAAEVSPPSAAMQHDLKYVPLQSGSIRIERQIDDDGKVFNVVEHNGNEVRRSYLGYIDKQTGKFRDVLQ